MKLTTLMLLFALLQVSAASLAQKVTLSEKNAPLSVVFEQIRAQTGYDFAYSTKIIQNAKPVTINVKNQELKAVLDQIFDGQPLDYKIDDKSVTVLAKQPTIFDKIKSVLNLDKINVIGRVIDDNNQPLADATIQVKGTNNTTSTDGNGFFSLQDVQPGATIVISFIGFDKKEVTAAPNMGVIKLGPATSPLDEVKVIAYGQTTERLSVGNVSSVKGKDIENQPVSNPMLAIEGRVPGLYIQQSNGLPGTSVSVRVQGINSLSAANTPLYVIDGVPYASFLLKTTLAGQFGSTDVGAGQGSPMSYINPADIESISVLKDADATAIYGSRAANGAILITTKKGKAGPTRVDFNIQNGWGKVNRTMPLMNTQQYLQMRHEAITNDHATIGSFDYDINGAWDTTRYTNWQKVLIGNTAKFSNANLSVSGGSNNIQYLVSGTFKRQTSVFPGDFSDESGALHFSLTSTSNNQKFKMQFTGSYLYDDNQLPQIDPTATALILAPDAPSLYNPDGTLNWQLLPNGANTWTNPLQYLYKPYQNKTNNLTSNAVLSYNLLPGLDLKTSLGYTNLNMNEFTPTYLQFSPPSTQASQGLNARTAGYSYNTISSWLIEPQLTYKKSIGKGHFEALFGATLNHQNSNGLKIGGRGYSSDGLLSDYASAATLSPPTTDQSVYKYDAIFGRLNYIWNEEYIIDLTVRRDGSSRFGPANEFHNFAAAAVGWVFTEEKFVKDQLPFLSFGKLKGSYGTTGNDQIGDYQFLNLYSSSSVSVAAPYQGVTGLGTTSLPNPNLQWEETRKLQAGFDLGFFKDRISLSATYFYNRSSNLLFASVVPATTGFTTLTENIPAIIQNKGFEFSLNSINIKNKDFRWSTNFNLTIPKNKLAAYNVTPVPAFYADLIGFPVGTLSLYHFLGVDPATGIYQFADSHGNPTTDPNQAVSSYSDHINTLPTFYGGLGNTIGYKAFSLDFLFRFVKKLQQNNTFGSLIPGYFGQNQPLGLLNRWQKPGDVTAVERYNSNLSIYSSFGNAQASNAGYSDGSFIRLQSLSLSYELPSTLLQSATIRSTRLYLQGQNLLTITKFKGLDPETGNGGLPPLRVIMLGLQVGL